MALTGATYGEKCFASQADAADAFYSSVAPVFTTSSGTNYLSEYVKIANVWNYRTWQITSTGVWSVRYTSVAQLTTFPSCDPSQSFVDGTVVGWGIAAAVAIGGCIKMLDKAK